jgi:hypothetical protein
MKSRSILSTFLLPLFCAGSLQAAVSITTVPAPDPFAAVPPTDQWTTLQVGTATDTAITTAEEFDTKVIAAADATAITGMLGSSGTNPPSANVIARQNTGANNGGVTFLQMRATTEDYQLLLGHLQNATGGPINSVKIAYEYSKATDTATELVKGLRAYWSLTGTPGSWALIPGLSVDTTGTYNAPQNISTSVVLPAPLADGGLFYLLFADQKSSGTDASYHIRNFAATPGVDAALSATATSGIRSPGASASDPSDDTVSFDLTVTGTGNVSPGGWTIVSPAALAGTTGAYGVPKTISNVPIAEFPNGVLQIRIGDSANPAAETSVSVRTVRVLGTNSVANTPILTEGIPPAGWVLDDAARTSTQNSSSQGDVILNSQIIDLSTVGAVQFSADLDAITGTSSGFETADSFALYLIIDGGAPISVLGAADIEPNERLSGMDADVGLELPGATEISVTRSFHFSYAIPEAANNVQIRIIGNSNSPSETFVVKNVTLSTGGGPAGDSDGDGVSDANEAIMGTDANNAADVLRLINDPSNPTQIQFQSKNGRFYRVYSSTDLQTWTGSGTTILGDGSMKQFDVTITGEGRRFYRLHVMATDGPWAP